MPCTQGHVGEHQIWSGSRRDKGKAWPTDFIVFSGGKAKKSKRNSLGLASLNDVGRLWSLGVIFSCPVPGPGKQGSCLLECKGPIEEVVWALNWLVYI